MKNAFKLGPSYKKKVKNDAIFACISVSLLILTVPSILLMDYWYYLIPLSLIGVALWIKYRWVQFTKELKHINQHTLVVSKKILTTQYANHKFQINLDKLHRMNVNIKRGKTVSIRLVLKDKTTMLIGSYKNMTQLKRLLTAIINQEHVTYHRWFHKT